LANFVDILGATLNYRNFLSYASKKARIKDVVESFYIELYFKKFILEGDILDIGEGNC